jgi:hypothetical protein
VLLLPLLATTHAWQQRLSVQPHAAPLAAMLGSLLGKFRGHWGSFCAGQVAAVEQYDSRSKMGLQQGERAVIASSWKTPTYVNLWCGFFRRPPDLPAAPGIKHMHAL